MVSNSLQSHGLYSPWNSPGQNTGVGSLCLLQGIFPTQVSNPGLPHFRWILYQLSHQGSPLTSIVITNFQIDFIHVDRDIMIKASQPMKQKEKRVKQRESHKNRGKGRNWVRAKQGKVNKQRNALSLSFPDNDKSLSLSWYLQEKKEKIPGKERGQETAENGHVESAGQKHSLSLMSYEKFTSQAFVSVLCLVGPQNLWVGRSQTLYLFLCDAEMSLKCFPLELKIGYLSITKLMKFHRIQSKIENARQGSASPSFFLSFLPSFFFFSFFLTLKRWRWHATHFLPSKDFSAKLQTPKFEVEVEHGQSKEDWQRNEKFSNKMQWKLKIRDCFLGKPGLGQELAPSWIKVFKALAVVNDPSGNLWDPSSAPFSFHPTHSLLTFTSCPHSTGKV